MNPSQLEKARRRVEQQIGRPGWSDEKLPNLDNQTRRLWGMVESYTGHPFLVDFLSELIRAYKVPARDPKAFVKAIQDYSVEHIKFFRERPERFASPLRTIAWGIGDCDDKSILIAAATRTFRIPTRLTILRLSVKGQRMGHVYPEVYLSGKWIPVESVRKYPWGHNPADVARSRGMLVKTERIGDKAELGSYA